MVVRILLFWAAFAATWLVRDHPFFWDTVQLASKQAHFFYEDGFTSIILPPVIDSGHPPSFGMYLALVWKLFGKTLPVSHFAMLPFIWGIIFFLIRIGGKLANYKTAPWLVVLCFADPVLASQSILVSPDIVLVCFFLAGVWAILDKKNGWLALAVVGLGVISMRGMMIGVGLYIINVLSEGRFTWPLALKKLLPFLPGGILAAAFLYIHWWETGWIGYHAQSTWAPSFEKVDFAGFVKNVAVFGWRLLDFGRIFVCLILGWFILKKMTDNGWKVSVKNSGSLSYFPIALLLVLLLSIVPSQLLHKGLLAHRYLLPIFIAMNLLLFYWATKLKKPLVLVIAIAGLATGNFWIYPKKISQGWDSTLAHLPWYGLSEKAEEFMFSNNIPISATGTAFPNIGPRENLYLNGIQEGPGEKNLTRNCYIIYSNIMNDFTDEEIDLLEKEWTVVKAFEKNRVCVILYKNPAEEVCEN